MTRTALKRVALVLAMLGVPAAAEACASCIASPFGDQTYNWPYLVLILVPFMVGVVIAAVMMRVTGVSVRTLARALVRLVHPAAPHKETT